MQSLTAIWVTVVEVVSEQQIRVEISPALAYFVRDLEKIVCQIDIPLPPGLGVGSALRADLENVSRDDAAGCYVTTDETKISKVYPGGMGLARGAFMNE